MEFRNGPMHDPNLLGTQEVTRGECGRDVGELIDLPAEGTHIRSAQPSLIGSLTIVGLNNRLDPFHIAGGLKVEALVELVAEKFVVAVILIVHFLDLFQGWNE